MKNITKETLTNKRNELIQVKNFATIQKAKDFANHHLEQIFEDGEKVEVGYANITVMPSYNVDYITEYLTSLGFAPVVKNRVITIQW